jgi:hypothetical protein
MILGMLFDGWPSVLFCASCARPCQANGWHSREQYWTAFTTACWTHRCECTCTAALVIACDRSVSHCLPVSVLAWTGSDANYALLAVTLSNSQADRHTL